MLFYICFHNLTTNTALKVAENGWHLSPQKTALNLLSIDGFYSFSDRNIPTKFCINAVNHYRREGVSNSWILPLVLIGGVVEEGAFMNISNFPPGLFENQESVKVASTFCDLVKFCVGILKF